MQANTSFLTPFELRRLGFRHIGSNVLISRYARFYGAERMSIGDNVRIDDFCILSGNITIGSNIHISAFVALHGSHGIVLEDYTGISARTTVYSAMDDFSGDHLVGPVHPEDLTNVTGAPVVLRRCSQIGAHCLIFPGVEIAEGAVIGACSMVRHSVEPWTINIGIPAKKLKNRNKYMLTLINKLGGVNLNLSISKCCTLAERRAA